jgi:hypothetical protein
VTGAIGQGDKGVIAGLSRAEVENTTNALRKFMSRSRWLGVKNRYRIDLIDRLASDIPLAPDHSRNLAQYIAASSTLHCLDAWSYLGRALASMLRGDTHRAIHLAYYAELRAALCLLATEGLGIFDKQHFVIDHANSTRKLSYGQGTHVAAWTALEYWSGLPRSGALFAQLVRPEGITLEEWFHPHGGTATLAAQAKSWFMQWGMDLNLAAEDREARNESSYQPDGIPAVWLADSGSTVDFVADLWRLLEPGAGSTFEQIDRQILRIALGTHFTSRFGGLAARSNPTFRAFIDDTLAAQSLSGSDYLREFLLRSTACEDAPLFQYSAMRPAQQTLDIFAIVSRAVLLLRVATGSVSEQLQNAGVNKASLEFWWESIGATRGLWSGDSPNELTDLWKDIEDALADIDADKALKPDVFDTVFDVCSSATVDFGSLCSPERVGLWAICRP